MSEEFHYSFNNDLRTSSFETSLIEAAYFIYENNYPSAREDRSTNNRVKVVEFYFNLYEDTNCNYYIRNGEIKKVMLNFITKFQFPAPRTAELYNKSRNDGIVLVPLKETIKLLYVGYLQDGPDSYITRKEIRNFLFFNSEIAKERYPDYKKVYNDILEYRISQHFPESIATEENRFWTDSPIYRQFNDIINLLRYTDVVIFNGGKESLSLKNELDINDKAYLHDIMIDNNFWDGGPADRDILIMRQEYKEYSDLPTPTEISEAPSESVYINKNKRSDDPDQKIFFGPPGTGKSYAVTQFVKERYPGYGTNKEEHPFVFRLMIHPEYSYFDFIGSILPVSSTINGHNQISYEFAHGIFVQSLITALNNEKYDVFLVLEEMSRGNIVSVFGELFQLLDRDSNGDSEYTMRNSNISAELQKNVKNWNSDGFYLPKNLHILGTVNTSDQNVFVMDTAFKRRFDFQYIGTDPKTELNNINGDYINKFKLNIIKVGNEDYLTKDWNELYPIINEFIVDKLELNEDKQIGQFFIKFKKGEDDSTNTYNYNQIKNKLFQYLWNDIHIINLTNISLFSNELKSFGQLYNKNIKLEGLGVCFSQDFLNFLYPENPNESH